MKVKIHWIALGEQFDFSGKGGEGRKHRHLSLGRREAGVGYATKDKDAEEKDGIWFWISYMWCIHMETATGQLESDLTHNCENAAWNMDLEMIYIQYLKPPNLSFSPKKQRAS